MSKLFDIVSNNLMLAPLAGYTDASFRKLCADYGCGLTVTEMVSCKAMLYDNSITQDLLVKFDNTPSSVQLFGHEPADFAKVAQKPQLEKFDIIDINMGCPVHKIYSSGDGSALMKDILLASQIIEALRFATNKLISVKFRLGIDERNINCVEFARMCEQSGADFITLHARTREQMYSGLADMSYVERVVDAVNIPVYANGDISSKESAENVLQQTNCYGLAIGRGALGAPWLFSEILGREYKVDLYETISSQYDMLISYLPARVVLNEMKKHLAYYFKGLRNAKAHLVLINTAETIESQRKIVKDFLMEKYEG